MQLFKDGQTDVKRVLGIIFSLVGLFNLGIGSVASLVMKAAGAGLWYLPLAIMGWIGLVFLLIGTVFLIVEKRRRAMEEELKNHGQTLEAEVKGVQNDLNVAVNGRHPYYLEAHWRDPITDTVHVFRSRDVNFDPRGYVEGRKVTVYVRDNDYSRYYMDLEHVLPKAEIH